MWGSDENLRGMIVRDSTALLVRENVIYKCCYCETGCYPSWSQINGSKVVTGAAPRGGELSVQQGIQDRCLGCSGRETKLQIKSGNLAARTSKDQAADITRLGLFSARALPIVSLCHIDPSRRDPALCAETSRMPETSPSVIIAGSNCQLD